MPFMRNGQFCRCYGCRSEDVYGLAERYRYGHYIGVWCDACWSRYDFDLEDP